MPTIEQSKVLEMYKDKVEAATSAAREKFWDEICNHFPEVEYNHLTDLVAGHFKKDTKFVVELWLKQNHPDFGCFLTGGTKSS